MIYEMLKDNEHKRWSKFRPKFLEGTCLRSRFWVIAARGFSCVPDYDMAISPLLQTPTHSLTHHLRIPRVTSSTRLTSSSLFMLIIVMFIAMFIGLSIIAAVARLPSGDVDFHDALNPSLHHISLGHHLHYY